MSGRMRVKSELLREERCRQREMLTIIVLHHNSRAPAVLEKLPGQIPGKAKVPSMLLYDSK